MNKYQDTSSVTVAVDGSACALRAVRWAARHAGLSGAELRVWHVNAPPPVRAGTPHRPVAVTEENPREAGERIVRTATNAAALAVPGLRITTEVVLGNTVDSLLHESGRTGVLVVGSRGLGGFRGLLIGSVATALAGHARCPVVVVPPRPEALCPPESGPVVLGVDGSKAGDAAIPFAFEAAAMRGAELVAVHTWSDAFADGAWSLAPLTAERDVIQRAEEELLAERTAPWREKYPEVRVRHEVVAARPSGVLVEFSRSAQLVVAGSRGRTAFAGIALGSTSQALLQYAQCPVAVVGCGG